MKSTFNPFTHIFLLVLFCYTLLITSCGKHESTGGVMGTATGAIIGASVAGKHDKATGAIIGGLLGNVVGTSVGRAADDEEREEDRARTNRVHARERARHEHEIRRMHQENQKLKQRWCDCCNREVAISGASTCPTCGGELIQKRICVECRSTFSPTSGYRYCPYCKNRNRLIGR